MNSNFNMVMNNFLLKIETFESLFKIFIYHLKKGCYKKVEGLINQYSVIVIAVAIGIGIILVNKIKQNKKFKIFNLFHFYFI